MKMTLTLATLAVLCTGLTGVAQAKQNCGSYKTAAECNTAGCWVHNGACEECPPGYLCGANAGWASSAATAQARGTAALWPEGPKVPVKDVKAGKATAKASPRSAVGVNPGSGTGGTAGKLVPWTTSMGHKCCASCIQYNDAGNCTKAGQCEPGYDSSCNKTQTQ